MTVRGLTEDDIDRLHDSVLGGGTQLAAMGAGPARVEAFTHQLGVMVGDELLAIGAGPGQAPPEPEVER